MYISFHIYTYDILFYIFSSIYLHILNRLFMYLYISFPLFILYTYIILYNFKKIMICNKYLHLRKNVLFDRPSMSQGTVMIQAQNNRSQEKDFTVATPEEFVHRFGGTRVINKVKMYKHSEQLEKA